MQRTQEYQANSARPFILFTPIPPWLRFESTDRQWQLVKDEVRGLAYKYGPSNIHEKAFNVEVFDGYEPLCAICDFKERSDAREIFIHIQGHPFEGYVMQAWLFEPGQDNYNCVGRPRDPVTGAELEPPVLVPYLPTPADQGVSRPRDSRRSSRARSNQMGSPTNKMTVDRNERKPNFPQDRIHIQHLPAVAIPTYDTFNTVDAVLANRPSLYAASLDSYQQRLGHFSPSSEPSDSSRTLHNTPELSCSSRNSSISAIPDAYLSVGHNSYGISNFIPGNPYSKHNSSVSSASNPYTPANSRNQSGSSYTFQDTASDEACKVIIRGVQAGSTHEELSVQLDKSMRRYVQHEKPKQGEGNKWSVKFSNEEDTREAKEKLHNSEFKGWKLQVLLSNGGPRKQINSSGSTKSATSSSIARGPTIIDGSDPD